LAIKNPYTTGNRYTLGTRFTAQPKIGTVSSVKRNVPVNNH
jgi:hypothetical protein